jgi:copper chaperone CopZ
MTAKWTVGILGAAVGLAGAALAADVKVTGIHNCCGACNGAINKALKGAGATNIKAAKGEVAFSADNADAAVKALFDAGFCGKVEGAKAPDEALPTGKAKEIKIEGVHNCCGQCNNRIQAIVKGLNARADSKSKQPSFTVSSDAELDVGAVIKALRDAGFNARVAK